MGVPRTGLLGRTARAMVILALVLGILIADAAAASGHGSGGHARAHQPAGSVRLEANSHLTSSGVISERPWMY
jgi:hypothetical protein